jgi:hypothetical protein
MTFEWEFEVGGRPVNYIGRHCHRGPMIDVEITMSQPFSYLSELEILRARLLDKIVTVDNSSVQTREVVLRVLNNTLAPIFARLTPRTEELQVLICEKRNSLDIESDLVMLNPFYLEGAKSLLRYGLPQQQIDLLVSALTSNNPVLRVAGKCATVLVASYIELDN